MKYTSALSALLIPMLLTACGSEESNKNTPTPAPSKQIDARDPVAVAKLGKDYTLQLAVSSFQLNSNKDFNIDITQYAEKTNTTGTFAQVHGIPERNYKTMSDADVSFNVTVKTDKGEEYQLTHFNLYYENFNSTSVPEKLALSTVEQDAKNVTLWKQQSNILINRDFVEDNMGVMFDLDSMRPMNLYVRLGETLSNGVQFLPYSAENTETGYTKISHTNCTAIEPTSKALSDIGILQKTCVSAHGYQIPLIIEDKSKMHTESKVAHVKAVMSFFLDNMDKEIAEAVYQSKASMAFFYDGSWDERLDAHMDELEGNYRFQDLFATETTETTSEETKPNLTGRDAAFEEILHFVHDYGVMKLAVSKPTSVWATMQKELDALNAAAIRNGTYYPNLKDANIVEADLDAESYDQEYLAYAIYAYYDINPTGHTSQEYKASTYNELVSLDPEMVKFLEKYFPSRTDFKTQFPGYPNNY